MASRREEALTLSAEASELLDDNQAGEALQLLTRALDLDDQCAWAWHDIAWARMLLGSPAEAERALARAIRLLAVDPWSGDLRLHVGLAKQIRALGVPSNIVASYGIAVAANLPQLLAATDTRRRSVMEIIADAFAGASVTTLIENLIELGLHSEARAACRLELARAPDNLYECALAVEASDRSEAGLAPFREALERRVPERGYAYQLRNVESVNDALATIRESARLSPSTVALLEKEVHDWRNRHKDAMETAIRDEAKSRADHWRLNTRPDWWALAVGTAIGFLLLWESILAAALFGVTTGFVLRFIMRRRLRQEDLAAQLERVRASVAQPTDVVQRNVDKDAPLDIRSAINGALEEAERVIARWSPSALSEMTTWKRRFQEWLALANDSNLAPIGQTAVGELDAALLTFRRWVYEQLSIVRSRRQEDRNSLFRTAGTIGWDEPVEYVAAFVLAALVLFPSIGLIVALIGLPFGISWRLSLFLSLVAPFLLIVKGRREFELDSKLDRDCARWHTADDANESGAGLESLQLELYGRPIVRG